MKINTDDQTYQVLLGDLVENILRYSDNPGACAQFITSQIRELIGVGLVALVSSDEAAGHTLIGLCPQKREAKWNQTEIQTFVTDVLSCKIPRLIDPVTDPAGKSLLSIGIGKSFVIPLLVGEERVGMLILLDLMEVEGAKTILYALSRVATVIALILKNSMLYKNLERQIAIRTEQLSNSEKLFRSLFEQSAVGVAQIDTKNGRFIRINKKFSTFIGYSLEELQEKDFISITHPDDIQATAETDALLMTGGVSEFTMDRRYIHKDGSTIWGNVTVSPLHDEGAAPVFHIAVVKDITEQKLVQFALTESQERMDQLAEQSRSISWEVDAQGLYTFISQVSEGVIGYSQNEVVGKKHFYDLHPEEGREAFKKTAFEVFERKDTFNNLVNPIQMKDGSLIWVSTNAFPLVNTDGTLRGYRGSDTDITERRGLEEERLLLEQQFMQAQQLESLGVLAGGIAHDFNNILAIIMGYCYLVKMDCETAEEYIPEIEKASERAAGLCRQMLAYAGKTQLTKAQVNIWMLLDEMVNMLKATIPQNAIIKPDLSADTPFIVGDASQIRQIVMNLIINASEAIGEAHGEILVSLSKTTITAGYSAKDYHGKVIPPGVYVCLEVTDNGCGMDEETKWRIFEPFYTTKFTGRGLGMSAVLGIIAAHKGALQLFSQPGQGSTFKVYLPAQCSEFAAGESLQKAVKVPWKGSGTILLVEDEDQVTLIARTMLKALGFKVIEASNGKEALDMYEKNGECITLVLTDIGMPVMDGYALFSKLKAINPQLPIVISSGFGDTVVTSRIAREDIAGLVSKPYSFDQLRGVLERVTLVKSPP